MASDDELARAGLARFAPPGDPEVATRVAAVGAPAVWAALAMSFPDADPAEDLRRLALLGGRLLRPGEPGWPGAVDDCARIAEAGPLHRAAPPLALWGRGPLETGDVERTVAVVGSRAATDYGVHVTGEIAAGLAERGFTVVSGAAYGVDGAAHRGALAVGGATVAVLAGGLDVSYPAGHAALLDRIGAEGLLLTESAPGVPAGRMRFLSRNRIIAALAAGTVLVEAGLRSGARNTLAYARALGRRRLVVPGPVTSAMSAGCHLELRTDPEARVVTGAEDVVEEVGRIGELLSDPRPEPGPRDGLPPDLLTLLDAMPARRGAGVGEIGSRAGADPGEVVRGLGVLAAEGLIESGPDGFRLTARGRRPAAG